jgi:hypothetical protein
MPLITRLIAGAVLIVAALTGHPKAAPAQDTFVVPTYSRLRTGAEDWHARGGRYEHGRHGGYGGYGYGGGYYQPYISPVIAGSWYARPYPYHFDYFRDRWTGQAPAVPSSSDCPCAELPIAAEEMEPAPNAAP